MSNLRHDPDTQNTDTYSEVHHIRPLGSPHNDPDIANNIIILCPNCHVLCEYGAVHLHLDALYNLPKHPIGN